jgi:hypothetical protein
MEARTTFFRNALLLRHVILTAGIYQVSEKINEPSSPSTLCQEEILLDQKQSFWETCLVTKSTEASQKDC